MSKKARPRFLSDQAGIYEIVNLATGKRYVGQAGQFSSRWAKHRRELRENQHRNRVLQNAWNKSGESEFAFRVLEVCEKNKTMLDAREQYWLDKLQPFPPVGYNLCRVAGSVLGYRWKVVKPRSPEHLAKLSEKRRLRVITDATREKVSRTNRERGAVERLLTPEARAAAIAAANQRKGAPTGRIYTDEQRERIAASNRASWTSERRQAQSERVTGTKRSPEARAKMSAAKKGKPSVKRADLTRCAKGLHEWVEGQKKGCRECNRAAKRAWDERRKESLVAEALRARAPGRAYRSRQARLSRGPGFFGG